jgi:hypothetical protein
MTNIPRPFVQSASNLLFCLFESIYTIINRVLLARVAGRISESGGYLTINKQVVMMEQVSVNQQALTAEMQTKEEEIHKLKERMDKMADIIMKLDSGQKYFAGEFMEVCKKIWTSAF